MRRRPAGQRGSRSRLVTELDYVETSTDLNVTATTAAGNDWLTGNTIQLDGSTTVEITMFCPIINFLVNVIFELYDSTTDLGRIAQLGNSNNGSPANASIYAVRELTPAAGAHTFKVKPWSTSGTTIVQSASPFVPSFLRVRTINR